MKYELKPDIHMATFLQAVANCRQDVLFETTGGDCLNLKSLLSKYLFLTLAIDISYLKGSLISCSREDAALLADYLQT